MDTWSVAQLILDAIFAVTVIGAVLGFLYFREKRLIRQLRTAPVIMPHAETAARPHIIDLPPTVAPTIAEPAPAKTRASRPPAAPKPQKAPRRPATLSANRAERYLEAVRMYRQGSDKSTIEKALGISFMELELLGRLK